MNFVKLTVLSLVLALLSGCKSTEETDYFRDITADLDSLQSGLKDGMYKVDSVTKSLDRLAGTQGDLRPPLEALDKAIADLDETSAHIRRLKDDLDAKEAAFQSTWSDEIKSVESASMRDTAERGRADVASAFDKLEQRSASVANTYSEWEAKVKSIQSSLQANLSPSNLQSLSSKINEAKTAVPGLKESIRKLTSDMEALSASMRSSMPS